MSSAEQLARPPQRDPGAGWGQSLSSGAAGIALLHIERAHADAGAWSSVQRWAIAMTRAPVTARPDACGLYRGAPAVAFALRAAQQSVYASALSALDRHITRLTRHRLSRAHQRIDSRRRPSLREFDLMSGLTGLGVYLLRRGDEHALRDVLAYLVHLTEPLSAAGETLPGWWTPNAPDDRPSPRWPGGHGNLGMAHGIAGPLALLALARHRGITVAGHTEAIQRICSTLDQWRQGTPGRPWWPGIISQSEWKAHTVERPRPQRPSWCYGTPGLARAQQLAAIALADAQRQRRAEDALASCIVDDAQLSQLGDASLCHGWAGVLQTTWRAAGDAGDHSPLAATLPILRARMDHHLRNHGPPVHDGLLEGTTGIHLARHTTRTTTPPRSHWDACLLLAD